MEQNQNKKLSKLVNNFQRGALKVAKGVTAAALITEAAIVAGGSIWGVGEIVKEHLGQNQQPAAEMTLPAQSK